MNKKLLLSIIPLICLSACSSEKIVEVKYEDVDSVLNTISTNHSEASVMRFVGTYTIENVEKTSFEAKYNANDKKCSAFLTKVNSSKATTISTDYYGYSNETNFFFLAKDNLNTASGKTYTSVSSSTFPSFYDMFNSLNIDPYQMGPVCSLNVLKTYLTSFKTDSDLITYEKYEKVEDGSGIDASIALNKNNKKCELDFSLRNNQVVTFKVSTFDELNRFVTIENRAYYPTSLVATSMTLDETWTLL